MSTLRYGDTSLHTSHLNGKTDADDHRSRSSKHKYKTEENGMINHTASRHKTSKESRNDIPEDQYKVKTFNDWSEQTSRAGKKYFYNCKTEVSQWEKPPEWVEFEKQRYIALKKNLQHTGDVKAQTFAVETVNHALLHSGPGTSGPNCNDDQSSRSSGNQHHRHQQQHNSVPLSGQQHNSRLNQQGSNLTAFSSKTPSSRRSDLLDCSALEQHNKLTASSSSPYSKIADANKRTGSTTIDYGKSSELKRAKYDGQTPTTSSAGCQPTKRPATMSEVAQSFGRADLSQQDQLPQLLIEIAEQQKIDLSDMNALEKIQFHLKAALHATEIEEVHKKPNVNGSLKRSRIAAHVQKIVSETTSIPNPAMDVSSQFVCTDLPPMPTFSDQHASFYKEAFSCKIRDWGATHVEHQANSIAERCFRLSLDVAQVSADLKCSRSLVRTAEIKSTLVDHRIGYLRKQYNQLETLNKPASSLASSSVLSQHHHA